MELTEEKIKLIIAENISLRRLIKKFKAYDERRKNYYKKVEADLEKYKDKYVKLKKIIEEYDEVNPGKRKLILMKEAYKSLQKTYDKLKMKEKLSGNKKERAKAEKLLERYDDMMEMNAILSKVAQCKQLKKDNARLHNTISELTYRICRLENKTTIPDE